MASAQMHLGFVPEAEVKTWEERAKQEARRALELDSDLAEAHEALAAGNALCETCRRKTLMT
jgi:hypothetical protein